MAKRVIPDYFSFTSSTRTITIPNRVLSREQILLVTNASSNTVIYNFSDPDLGITSFTSPYNTFGTQFTLAYNTTAMNNSDPLAILVDETDQSMIPNETYLDATNKLRVTTPQSLIDTDFEYGLQPIKWEALTTLNTVPSYFLRGGGNSLNVATISGDGVSPRSTITVGCNQPHGLNVGDVVNVAYTTSSNAEGAFTVLTTTNVTSLTYQAKALVNGTVFTSAIAIQGGAVFDSDNVTSRLIVASVASDNAAGAGTGSTITVTTTGRHGLMPGAPIMVRDSATTSSNGNWTVYDVPSTTTFRYQTAGSSTTTTTPIITGNFAIMVRPEANFVHRPSDGGVMISTNNLQQGVSAIRQTRRYFRYQSGKGIMMSTGTKFTPSFDINTLSSAGVVATATVQQALNIQSGTTIVVEGVITNSNSTNYFNGTFTSTGITSSTRTLTWNMAGTPTDTSPGGQGVITVKNWKGSSVRVGFFDYQNGFYYEYDGTTFFAVRRNSTKELMGTISVTNASTTVTGTGTQFHKQLISGDNIVIRGATYQVISIDSATSLEISPAYRGTTVVSGIRANLVQNLRIPQNQWNLDRCDGTGPSGYVLDVSKMQMCYIDYTWYGAGFIRFGFRGTDGNVIYVHKIANNNLNNQAYMRSGNLPARYEVTNIGPFTRLVGQSATAAGITLLAADTQMTVADATYWPANGQIAVYQTSNVEIMSYSSKTLNTSILLNGVSTWTLNGLTRRQFGANTGNLIFVPSEFEGGTAGTSAQCAIAYITCDCAPLVMHWGTSVIMDGGYNDDRSIQFAYTKPSTFTIAANTSVAILSLRLAPAVDNSITGQFSTREVVNRMQLQTKSMGLVTNTSIQVLGVLNCFFSSSATVPSFPTVWTTTSIVQTIGTGSLAQVIDHTGVTTTVYGGEQVFGFVTSNTGDTYDISAVRDLGTSIISGNGSTRTPGYPNGPDVLTIVLRNTNTGPAIVSNLRLSWTEAQA